VQHGGLGPADPVLGRDRPAVLGGQPQDRLVHAAVARSRAEHVHVQVAHADMAEHDRARVSLRYHVVQLGPERGQPAQRQRHIQLVRDADRADRLGVSLPVRPQGRPGLPVHGQRGILEPGEHHDPFGFIFGDGRVHQQVTGMLARQRGGQPGVRAHQGQSRRLEVLGGADPRYRADLGHRGDGRLDIRHAGQRGERRWLGRPKEQPGGGDDPEGALAADQQAGQVVAGVVGPDAAEPADHAAVGQHRLQAEQLRPRRTVPDRLDAARVGGDRAADRRGVPGGQVDAVLEARPSRVRAQVRDRHAGAGRDLAGQRVHRVQPLQPPGGQHDGTLTPGSGRHAAADQAGVPALRHDRGAVPRAGGNGRGDRGGVGRADHAAGGPAEPARPVRGVPGGEGGIGEHVLWPGDRGQLGEQGVHEYSPYGAVLIYSAFQITNKAVDPGHS
jgi:hypothetical protein